VSLSALVDDGQSINYCSFGYLDYRFTPLKTSLKLCYYGDFWLFFPPKIPLYEFALLPLFSGLQVPRILSVTTTNKFLKFSFKRKPTFKQCFLSQICDVVIVMHKDELANPSSHKTNKK
jgi:hypothetical protein